MTRPRAASRSARRSYAESEQASSEDDEHRADDAEVDAEEKFESEEEEEPLKRRRRATTTTTTTTYGTTMVRREKRRSSRQENKPRKRYVDDDDDDEFVAEQDDDDDDEFEEEDEEDFIEDESDDEPVRRSTRARERVNRLSPTFKQRNDDDEEEELEDGEEETDDDDIGDVANKTYPKRTRGPPPERFAPQRPESGKDRSNSGRPGLFERRGTTWKDDRDKTSSRERSRRQTSGRWIDDSEDSDDGEFNLGAGAMDAFKAPPAYPLAGAGPSSATPGPNVDAEISPVPVDPTFSFSSVGGQDKYVDALKEMVFLKYLI